MPERLSRHLEDRPWRMLLVYDIYRLISVILFLGIYIYGPVYKPHSYLYFSILFLYFIFGLMFLYFWQSRSLSFVNQVLLSGTIDIVAISTMLNIIGNLKSGYGILLYVTIAALSILVPGRLAIFFASMASFLLIGGNTMHYFATYQNDLGTLYDSGIYGAGFFATALTAWYLAKWVYLSETLAQKRSDELAGMQKINEYIVERLHSGIIYVDEHKHVKLINSAARTFLEVSKTNLPLKLQDISPQLAQKCDTFLGRIKQNVDSAQVVLEEPYLKVHLFSTHAAANPAVLIILEDMTNIAQQAQQLKLASLGRFSASIAHELRNPLGAIAHAIQLVGEDGKLSEEDARLKQLVIKNCDRMNGVIKNVLQLSRRQKSQPQTIDIELFLEQFKQEFCSHHACEMDLRLPKDKPLHLVFDKSQLDQILIILCDNAMVHGKDEQGKVTIIIALKISTDRTTLTVSDMGPGIPEELKNDVFEPFFTTLRSGTGMGLFIARDLCEINQARLNITNSSKGTCFAITINPSDEPLI